jgi:hypothetical protein
MNTDAIGGYLSLELPHEGTDYHRDALRFQSSRAAFLALLRACRPTAVWMPWYICESMLEPLAMAGVPVKRYALDERLRVKSANLADGEWLLYVNYFGLCDSNVDDVLDRFPREQVVIDNAQAFFSEPRDCAATLYSPRKFVGVPDGGYLFTRHDVPPANGIDDQSPSRFMHLLKRIDAGAEAGYADYATAEESLKLQEPKEMSTLTQRLLGSVDYPDIRARRIANFVWLHGKLRQSNAFPSACDRDRDSAPLCYPYLGGPADLRARLIAQRVYTPCYWPEIATAAEVPEFEKRLAGATVFLPCDHRLSVAQLDRVVKLVLDPGGRYEHTSTEHEDALEIFPIDAAPKAKFI